MEYGESLMEVSDIIGSLVIREGNLSLITEHNGDIPLGEEQGFGLYHRDCRFLSGYVLRLNGRLLTSILSSDEKDYASTIVMTNRDFKDNWRTRGTQEHHHYAEGPGHTGLRRGAPGDRQP